MPNWNEILNEVHSVPRPLDIVRRKYLDQFHKKTKRNIITYYSGFLQKDPSIPALAISDADMNAFMNAVYKLPRKDGLDLVLHTPGGYVSATEAIVNYLHQIFDHDIRCFIPQLAMSGGTMIACACKVIYMGKQSNIGPIDPQFGGIPAHGVLEEFRQASMEIKEPPERIPLWQSIIGKYHPTFISECQHAINLSSDVVKKWLMECMFSGEQDAAEKAKKIVESLNNHADTKTHSRHINAEKAKSIGLKIQDLESDHDLQDCVLSLHHIYMQIFNESNACKIVENHRGSVVFVNS